MTTEMELEGRLRAGLHAALDGHDGPHPVWATAPAAIRAAATVSGRRGWSTRLLGVAAIVAIGAAGLLVAGRLQQDDRVGGGCPTLADYAAASPQPGSVPTPAATPEAFPSVAPTATQTTGLHPPGSWLVVADEDGPRYQMRVRDVRPCDRLPTVRPASLGGSLLLAEFDVEQLRVGGLGPWVGPDERLLADLGHPQSNVLNIDRHFGVPGTAFESSLSPRPGFRQSGLFIIDLPPTEASVQVRIADEDLPSVDGPGWRVREGNAAVEPGRFEPPWTEIPRPGPTDTTGQVPVGQAATLTVDGRVMTALVAEVEAVPGYPAFTPPEGSHVLEARIRASAWAPGDDPQVDASWGELPALRWVATDRDGAVLPNLGDESPTSWETGELEDLSDSTMPFGFLAIVVPEHGPVRLALEADGHEVAWWVLRD